MKNNLVNLKRNGVVYKVHQVQRKNHTILYSVIAKNGKVLPNECFMYVKYGIGGPAAENREIAKKRFKHVMENRDLDKDITSACVTVVPPQFSEKALSVSTVMDYNLDNPYGKTNVHAKKIGFMQIDNMRKEFLNDAGVYVRRT